MSSLCKITVGVLGSVLSLQIFLLNQDINTLLYHRNLGLKSENMTMLTLTSALSSVIAIPCRQLVKNLSHELLMFQHLPCLHDPHDGGLDEELPVLLDVHVGLNQDVYVHSKLLVLVAVGQVHGGVSVNVVLVHVHVAGPHQEHGLEEDGQDLDQDVQLNLGGLASHSSYPPH